MAAKSKKKSKKTSAKRASSRPAKKTAKASGARTKRSGGGSEPIDSLRSMAKSFAARLLR